MTQCQDLNKCLNNLATNQEAVDLNPVLRVAARVAERRRLGTCRVSGHFGLNAHCHFARETFSGGTAPARVTKLPVRGRIYASFSDIEYRIRSYGKMVEVTSTVVPLAAR